MVMCYAWDCNHYSERQTCRFFVFPKNPNEKKRWISLLGKPLIMAYQILKESFSLRLKVSRRKHKDPSAHSVVCSCHFVNCDRKNGPTIFERRKSRRFVDDPSNKKPPKAKRLKKKPATVASTITISSDETDERSPSPTTSHVSSPERQDAIASKPKPKIVIQFPMVATLEAEKYFLNKALEEAQEKAKKSTSFSFTFIENSNEKIALYTGLPSKEIFMRLFEIMDSCPLNWHQSWSVVNVTKIDQLLLTLMKLKLNLVNEDLAMRFNVSSATVVNIFHTWLRALHDTLFKKCMQTIPSENKLCRVILDSAEIYCNQPKDIHKELCSSGKHRNTLKGLIGVSPNGVVTYASQLYPGSESDEKIVEDCGILNQMLPGDSIIADEGILIYDLLPPGVSLNTSTSKAIEKAHILVTRAIRRMKCYTILSLVPSNLIPHGSIIYQVCAALTNFQFANIRKVDSAGKEDEC